MAESVRSVSRALDLLEQLAEHHDDMSLTELARLVELQPPTTHRLLQTLVERGWVVQNPSTTRYRLSYKLLGIGGDLEPRIERLRALARPHLGALRDLSGESTNLVVLDGLGAVYIDQAPSQRPIRMFAQTGARVPLYASGAGKAMLAFAPHVARALRRSSLKPLTRHTVKDFDALEQNLQEVRRLGYAYDNEEYEIGVACTAAPIRGADGASVAAISVSAPTARWGALDRAELGRELARHAREISTQLGHVATE